MNPHQKWLLAAVPICLKARLVNIANTCEQAAAEIERLANEAALWKAEWEQISETAKGLQEWKDAHKLFDVSELDASFSDSAGGTPNE